MFFFNKTSKYNSNHAGEREWIRKAQFLCLPHLQQYFCIFENTKWKFSFLRSKLGQHENIWTPDTGQWVRSKYFQHLLLWHMKLFIKIKTWFMICLCTLPQVCYLKQCVNCDILELPYINSREKAHYQELKFALAAVGSASQHFGVNTWVLLAAGHETK